ncbi:MAG TPA: AAA family ATPase, partial [Parvularculaceae bacterium]|nr:AAA family ATPase [Parvularculaceae bacterium]HRX37878.1 AAA family ATPase [Parvularculaceae bacterium]
QSDVVRKRIHGVSPNARLPESAYEKKNSDAVYRRMLRDAHRALKAGAVVILDATFLNPAERAAAAALAQKLGVPFDGFWLTAPRETLLQRVAKRKGDPSDATTAVLERQLAACEEPTDWRKIDASAGLSASLA